MRPGLRGTMARVGLAAAALCAVAPAAASAATIGVSGGTLTYAADNGETNSVSISKSGSSFNLTDGGAATITAGPGCTGGGGLANCSAAGVTAIAFDLGDRDDTVTVANAVGVPTTQDGGDGDDTFQQNNPPVSADTMIGGDGTDTADYGARGQAMAATMGDGLANDGASCPPLTGATVLTCENDDIGDDVENLVATSGADVVVGSDAGNDIDLRLGSDVAAGGKGNDSLHACCDAKTFVESDPGNGDDTFSASSLVDTVTYGPAPAKIEAAAPGQFPGRSGDLTVDADGAADDGETGEHDNVPGNVDNITGGAGNDQITGGVYLGNSANTLRGGAGNDLLIGAGGNDQLFGDDDDDSFTQGASPDGGDVIHGGDGIDGVYYTERTAASPLSISNDGTANDGNTLAGNEAEPGVLSSPRDNVEPDVENLLGGAGADTITGNSDDNLIFGGDGVDALDGGGGNDTFAEGTAPNGGDTLNGNTGIDTVDYSERATSVNVTLETSMVGNDGGATELDNAQNDENANGSNTNDTLTGQTSTATANVLSGNGGADTITGNDGADVLTGGPGAGDSVSAGPGDDDIRIRDTLADSASCGTGTDTVNADGGGVDTIDLDCETTDLSDSAEPDTMILPPKPADPTKQTSATFFFTGSDDKTTPENLEFKCTLDGSGAADCNSGDSFAVGAGMHTFTVAAVDEANKVDSTPASYTWTVDTAAPAAPMITGPVGGTPTADATPEFSFSGESGGHFECRIDSSQAADFAPCASPFTAPHQSDGSHTLDVRQVDGAGNVGAAASKMFEVDTMPPAAPTITGPDGGTPTNDPTPHFTLSGEPGGQFECRIDSTLEADFAVCPSSYTTAMLADGTHTLDVRQRDAVGNAGQLASKSFRVDTAAPDTALTGGPADGSTVTGSSQTFTYTSPDSTAHFECSLDGEPFSGCPNGGITYNLSAGVHVFSVRAVDAAGNEDGTPPSVAFTVVVPSSSGGQSAAPAASAATTPSSGKRCGKGKKLKKTKKGKKRCVKKKHRRQGR